MTVQTGSRRVGMIGVVLAVVACIGGPSRADARDDWQWWHATTMPVASASFEGGASYQLSLQQFVRLRDDMGEPFWVQETLRNAFKLDEHWTVAANYSFVRSKGATKWRDEHWPELEVTPSWSALGLDWKNRARLEARLIQFDAAEVNWRFRNQLQASKSLTIAGRAVKVFVNEEPFYDVVADEWNQNRVFVGANYAVTPHVNMGVAWGVQSVRTGSDWDERQLIDTSVNIRF